MTRPEERIRVSTIENGGSLKDRLAIPTTVYAGDPNWTAPLDLLGKQRISRKHAEVISVRAVLPAAE